MFFHGKMFEPAIQGLKAGKALIFRTTVCEMNHVTESRASDFVIITWWGLFFVHGAPLIISPISIDRQILTLHCSKGIAKSINEDSRIPGFEGPSEFYPPKERRVKRIRNKDGGKISKFE
jgi:hypothetical protein